MVAAKVVSSADAKAIMESNLTRDEYVLIIGAMKCGTSSLFRYLAPHPEICPSTHKEPEYFSENQSHGVTCSNYNDLWDFDDSNHRYRLEASTGYTKYPGEKNVPKRIHDYGIQPKFIYIVRDPFDRIESRLNFMVHDLGMDGPIEVSDNIVFESNYFLQLERYLEFFPIERLLVIDFDELKTEPQVVLSRIYDFLQISKDFFPKRYGIHNQTNLPGSTRAGRLLKSLDSNWVLRRLPTSAKGVGEQIVRKFILKAPQGAKSVLRTEVLSDSQREEIYNLLKDDMVMFQEKYGIDVKKWGFGNA